MKVFAFVRLGGQCRKLGKGADSRRQLPFADHVGHLDPFECRRSWEEGLEPEPRPDPLLDRPVVLLDHVVEMFDPDHFDRDRADEALQHVVDRVDPSGVGSTLVDDNSPGQTHSPFTLM